MFKKIKYFLQLWDFTWSVPVAWALFVLYGIFGQWFFGDSFGFYDPSFFQAIIYAILISVTVNGSIMGFLWFNFRTVYRYYVGQSKEDFLNLPATHKIIIFLILFLYSGLSTIWIFSKLV